jgi:hypothetical protein
VDQFQLIERLLDEKFPGRFTCEPGRKGRADGLSVRCRGRDGYAFVYERTRNQPGHLLALHEGDGDEQPEVWAADGPEEVVRRIEPWAFPPPWTPPDPVGAARERARLQRIAAGLSDRVDIPCRFTQPTPELLSLLTDRGREAYEHDVASVAGDRLVRHFPCDAAGRLALKTVVLLNSYETVRPPGRDRDLCLAAVAPERRRDEQAVRVVLTDLIVVNQTHRWASNRWLWTPAEVPPSEQLGTEAAGPSAENDRARESLRLLDAGRTEEAMGLYGVAFSEDVHRLLGGERIKPPACCAHPDAAWRDLLIGTLRQAAPWLLPRAVAEEAERLRQWAAGKKGRRRRAVSLKLVIFPGQFHSRKASLMLTGDVDGGSPRFVIDATASNARLHETAWKRPLSVDLDRYGVEGS